MMSLISLIGTGAGLLANGVKSLFDGTLKAKRQEKKAAKAAAKATKSAAVTSGSAQSATPEAVNAALMALGYGGTGQMGGAPTPGKVAPGGTSLMSGQGGAQVKDFLTKNWMWIAIGALVLFGGKLLKGKRTYRRRRAAPRTVVRYRTRRAPTRRRKR